MKSLFFILSLTVWDADTGTELYASKVETRDCLFAMDSGKELTKMYRGIVAEEFGGEQKMPHLQYRTNVYTNIQCERHWEVPIG